MLIGHRFERTAQGDLHIHSRNRVQSAFVLLTGAMAFILPLAFVVFGFSAEHSPLADLDPLSSLLIVLGLLLIPALGLLLMVYTEVVVDPAARATAAYRPAPARDRAAKGVKPKGKELTSSHESGEKLGLPARALLTLLGAFLAVLELTHVIALMRALLTGRLRVSGLRTGSTSFYWAEQPMVFSFNLLVGIAEVLIIGLIAWGCLRTAILGRLKANPR